MAGAQLKVEFWVQTMAAPGFCLRDGRPGFYDNQVNAAMEGLDLPPAGIGVLNVDVPAVDAIPPGADGGPAGGVASDLKPHAHRCISLCYLLVPLLLLDFEDSIFHNAEKMREKLVELPVLTVEVLVRETQMGVAAVYEGLLLDIARGGLRRLPRRQFAAVLHQFLLDEDPMDMHVILTCVIQAEVAARAGALMEPGTLLVLVHDDAQQRASALLYRKA